jgi:hypothetical protein
MGQWARLHIWSLGRIAWNASIIFGEDTEVYSWRCNMWTRLYYAPCDHVYRAVRISIRDRGINSKRRTVMQHILEPPGFKGVSSSPLTYYQHLQAHLSNECHLHKLMSASKTGTAILGAGIFAKESMQDDQVPSSPILLRTFTFTS